MIIREIVEKDFKLKDTLPNVSTTSGEKTTFIKVRHHETAIWVQEGHHVNNQTK